MKKSRKLAPEKGGLAEAYFRLLETSVRGSDGVTRQPAASKFVAGLREVHARGNGGRGVAELVGDALKAGRLWVWSDQHLGHKALEKLRGRSVGETDAVMLSNALATVSKEDVLIFGGDISMTDIGTANAWLRQLPPTKILVLGNHDFDKQGLRLKLAVDAVVSCLELPGFFATHYPTPELVMDAVRPGERIVNLHGHMHGRELDRDEFGSGARHVDMSVECIDFAPVLASRFNEVAKSFS